MNEQKRRAPGWLRTIGRMLLRLVIALVAIIVIAGVRGWWHTRNVESDAHKELEKYSVGQCLTLAKAGTGLRDVKPADAPCDRDLSYTVASRIEANGQCPNENYVEYSVEVSGTSAGKLCLVENLTPGHCYESDLFTKLTQPNDSCGGLSTNAPFRVQSRTETEGAPCPSGTTAVSYPQPPRTYCETKVATLG